MLFAAAQSFSEAVFWTLMFVGVGIWSARRLFGQFDSKGEIKGAAQKGIISMIGRWLK